jgi:diguanylate cyclase (GGDEF)-like protein
MADLSQSSQLADAGVARIRRLKSGERTGGWLLPLLLLLLVLLSLAGPRAWAQSGQVFTGVIGGGGVLTDTSGQFTVAEVNQRFESGQGYVARPEDITPTLPGQATWYRIALPAVTTPTRLILTVPHPGMDRIDFYRPTPDSGWSVDSAGDSIPVSDWPMRNLYPSFRFEVQPGEERNTYMRVQHSQAISLHWEIWDAASFFENSKLLHMLIGAYAGLVLVVVLQAAFHAISWRDAVSLAFAGHVAVALLAQLALTGLTGEYFWPNNAWWNDRAPVVLSMSGLALLHVLVRQLVVERGERWLSHALLAMALAGLLIALGFVAIGRSPFFALTTPYILLSFLLLLAVAGWYAWHRPSVGLWLLVALLAVTIGGVFPVMRNEQLLSMSFATQYGAQFGVGAEIGLLLIALHFRNRQRRDSQLRVGALAKVDPLTGLANHKVMLQRLEQLIQRQKRDPSLGAVVRVRVSNAIEIRQEYGMEAAQAAVVHAGACITGVLREGDVVARHRDGDFVLILGGHTRRDELSDLGQRLIARGLGDSQRLPVNTVLQLKVAIAEAPFRAGDHTALRQALGAALAELSAKPGKALRFIV